MHVSTKKIFKYVGCEYERRYFEKKDLYRIVYEHEDETLYFDDDKKYLIGFFVSDEIWRLSRSVDPLECWYGKCNIHFKDGNHQHCGRCHR
jgi:hypothetical protein